MAFTGYREASRTNWGPTEGHAVTTIEQINCGALLRIADATELMARRYTELIDAKNRAESYRDVERRNRERAERRLNAARGQITKLKKLLAKEPA